MRAIARVAGLLAFVLPLVIGCTPGKHPFLMAQMCLTNDQGVAGFIDELRAIAATEQMAFADNSKDVKRELEIVGYSDRDRTRGSHVLNIGVQRADGLGIGVSNVGLPGYQVALGFSEGNSAVDAHAFANRVVDRLSKRWPVSVVPSGAGAKPMSGCD
jgi:hypothetical protein